MSRIDELKKQFPELNMTIFDLFERIDTTSTYKYFPLLCKVFGKRFNMLTEYASYDKERRDELKLEFHETLLYKGVSTDGLTDNELFFMHYLTDHFNSDTFYTVKDFIRHMDRNQIENKDVTSYSTVDDLRAAVTLASIKELTKELESQVIKEYEDDKWLVVRPLTFQASSKYGASTRWCTTYQKEKQYFEKYWQNGILVYFINKQTGYKFAGFKGLHGDTELSFWNAEDSRVDYLYVEADDYLFPIVRRILNSSKTNKQLCSEETILQVRNECGYNLRKMSLTEVEPMVEESYDGPMVDEMEVTMEERVVVTPRIHRDLFQETMDRMGREISEEIDNSIIRSLSREERMERAVSFHRNTVQGVEDILNDNSQETGPMRA